MTETRKIHDPFIGKQVEISNRLTDRLRGKYACGPTMPNGEPEFGWDQYEVAPIQQEAAAVIDALVKALEKAKTALIKIRGCSIVGCEWGYGKPEKWADALFASHADVAAALKTIETAIPRPECPPIENIEDRHS